MLKNLQSIPSIFRGLMVSFLTILMIRVTFPIANYIMGLFTKGTMMYYSTIIVYWLIIIFVTWVMFWITIFKSENQGV